MSILSLDQALDLIATLPRAPLGEEEVPLTQAVGRLLSRPVHAAHDQPPFDRSPLDGFALRSEDTVDASEEAPLRLAVPRERFAGDEPGLPIWPGSAVRIMTGAALPEGADCVIKQEEVEYDGHTVTLTRPLRADENRVFRGEDYRAGSLLLEAGLRLDASAVGLLGSAGVDRVWCRERLRAAALSTGDELCTPGEPLAPGHIYDGNRFYLSARLRELGVDCSVVGQAGDDAGEIADWVAEAVCAGCHLVVTTGGVSVGQRDVTPDAMELLGADLLFHRIAVRPGTPALLALYRGVPVLSLSGNPFAAAATFELLGGPILAGITGDPRFLPRRVHGRLAVPFRKGSPVRRIVRGRWEDGEVTLPEGHSSGQLRSLVGCNCLLDIPEGTGPLEANDPVEVLLF